MTRSIFLLILALCTGTSSAFAQSGEEVQKGFEATHAYLAGAIICRDYTGELEVELARGLVRRLWQTGGFEGELLEQAVAESERRLVAQQGDRTMASELPGNATIDIIRQSCAEQLAENRLAAERAVLSLE